MKKIALLVIFTLFVISDTALASFCNLGYVDRNGAFAQFASTPSYFDVQTSTLQSADRSYTTYGNILNGTTTPESQLSVSSSNQIALISHTTDFALYNGNRTSNFPMIWKKLSSSNPDTDTMSYLNPRNFITGTDNNKYYQMGLTINASYDAGTTYQWSIYVFADKDILLSQTDGGNGRVLDPRVSTMRWIAWSTMDANSDPNGIPKRAFGTKNPSTGIFEKFNVLPLFSGTDAQAKKTFLTSSNPGSAPETASGYSTMSGYAENSFPNDGQIYYNTDRNIQAANNANYFYITNRTQIGLVYAAPNNINCEKDYQIHMQFYVLWPSGVAINTGNKSCDINIYFRSSL